MCLLLGPSPAQTTLADMTTAGMGTVHPGPSPWFSSARSTTAAEMARARLRLRTQEPTAPGRAVAEEFEGQAPIVHLLTGGDHLGAEFPEVCGVQHRKGDSPVMELATRVSEGCPLPFV